MRRTPDPHEESRPATEETMLIDKDVPMRTRDGVTLRADIYRPDAAGRFPVLLSRLPYDKNGRRRPGDIDPFVERGYVVIIQDTRGRFASDGDEYYRSSGRRRTGTTPSSGPRSFRSPTARSARWDSRTSARRSTCSRRRVRRT
jgi:hypothetical protein